MTHDAALAQAYQAKRPHSLIYKPIVNDKGWMYCIKRYWRQIPPKKRVR